MSSYIKAELAATCTSLGRFHNGKYIVDSQCYESVRDLIRYLRRDDEYHEIRRYLGEAKILQSDLIHVVINSSNEMSELFDITVRLLVNLTNPVMLLYREEIPIEKVGRNIYMNLISYLQEYKMAFCNIEFWNVICGKLTDLFEMDWTERSEDNAFQIERMLVLLRNVLQVPADVEYERRPENDITIHDKVLWALRQSQLLELLLYISSSRDEERYYLHLLEIFSLILREQNPKLLANCEIRRSDVEKEEDLKSLLEVRRKEKESQNKYKNLRNFNTTFVLKNVKSISDKDVVYHKSLDKLGDLRLTQDKKRLKTPKNRFPIESERVERRSTFSVRLFLKEFCVELLNCSYNRLMNVVKDKLDSGKGLSNDESYYFWSLKFFLEFNCSYNLDIKLISESVNVQTFHFVQTQLENCFEHLVSDKSKSTVWVRRIHLILKAYHSLLQTLQWMDSSKDSNVREISKVLKSQIFYVVEYREMMLYVLFKYDPYKFSTSYLRDLIETTHLFLKLLEDFCKKNRFVVQKKGKKQRRKKKKEKLREAPKEPESYEMKWDKVKDSIFELLQNETSFPDMPPIDPLLDISDDEQKENAMKRIQRLLHAKKCKECIGLLRSSRQVWPENDVFGGMGMSVEDEVMILQEICLAELGNIEPESTVDIMDVDLEQKENDENEEDDDDDEEDEDEEDNRVVFSEQNFDVKDFIKRLANKKLVEACSILLRNYKKNSSHTNHCVVKLLFRIGWECCMPSMLYQASLFLNLLNILDDKHGDYKEINKFTVHLFRKFRENAKSNPKIFMELLFWKEPKVAFDIENGYGKSEESGKAASWSVEEEDELRRLWVESDETLPINERVEKVRSSLINDSRSRIAVMKKLKELFLIPQNYRSGKSKPISGKVWAEEEVEELKNLFNQFRDAMDVATMIADNLTIPKTKISIKRKLVEIGLVENIAQLKKKKSRKKSSLSVGNEIPSDPSDNETDDENEDEDEGYNVGRTNYSMKEQLTALQKVENMKTALEWLKETFEECIEDDDDSDEGYPLLAIDSAQAEALESEDFLDMIKKLGLIPPSEQQVYWKVPKSNRVELHSKLEYINKAINGALLIEDADNKEEEDENEDSNVDEFDRLRGMMNKRKEPTPEQSQIKNSMDSDTGDEHSDSNISENYKARRKKINRALDSDGSDVEDNSSKFQNGNEESDDDNNSNSTYNSNKKTKSSAFKKSEFLAPESEQSSSQNGNALEKNVIDSEASEDEEGRTGKGSYDYMTKWKRRRCIGSDSEIEESGSGEEEIVRSEKQLKRPKMIDSDSDFEGNGSMDDNDTKKN